MEIEKEVKDLKPDDFFKTESMKTFQKVETISPFAERFLIVTSKMKMILISGDKRVYLKISQPSK